MISHVTNNDEADITELESFRVRTNKENEKSGIKVTMLTFVIKAVVAALKKYPDFNASLDGDALVYFFTASFFSFIGASFLTVFFVSVFFS